MLFFIVISMLWIHLTCSWLKNDLMKLLKFWDILWLENWCDMKKTTGRFSLWWTFTFEPQMRPSIVRLEKILIPYSLLPPQKVLPNKDSWDKKFILLVFLDGRERTLVISRFLNQLCLKNNWVNQRIFLHVDIDWRKVKVELKIFSGRCRRWS